MCLALLVCLIADIDRYVPHADYWSSRVITMCWVSLLPPMLSSVPLLPFPSLVRVCGYIIDMSLSPFDACCARARTPSILQLCASIMSAVSPIASRSPCRDLLRSISDGLLVRARHLGGEQLPLRHVSCPHSPPSPVPAPAPAPAPALQPAPPPPYPTLKTPAP